VMTDDILDTYQEPCEDCNDLVWQDELKDGCCLRCWADRQVR